MPYRVAGIDVHKKMLAVVVTDVKIVGNAASGAGAVQSRAAGTQERFPRCRTPGEAAGGPGIDSELCARCRATSLAVTRKKYQLRCDRVRLQNRVQSLLEEAHIKLSSLVSDLLGVSARRMLKALADGETSPTALAALADERLRATPEQLCDALGACTELNAVYRRMLKMVSEELRLIDEQIGELDKEMASLLSEHQDAFERLAEVPGLGVDPAQQIIAEVGPTAATFPSEKCLSSCVGACPGDGPPSHKHWSECGLADPAGCAVSRRSCGNGIFPTEKAPSTNRWSWSRGHIKGTDPSRRIL